MATIASLVVSVSANTAKFASDLGNAERRLGGLRASVDRNSAGVGQLGLAAKTAIAGVVVMAARKAWRAFRDLSDEIDRTLKTAQRLQIDYNELRGLQFAAEQTGVSADKLSAGLETMSKRLGEAGRGSGAALAALKDLGLEARDLIAMSPAEAFAEIAERLEGIPEPARQAAIVANIFSKANMGLLLTLREGRQGLADYQREMRGMSGVSDDAAPKFAWLNDEANRLGHSIQGVGEALATTFVEALKWAHDGLNDLVGSTKDATEATRKHAAMTLADVEAMRAAVEEQERLAEAAKKAAQERKTQLVRTKQDIHAFLDALGKEEMILKGIDPLDIRLWDVLDRAREGLPIADFERYERVLHLMVDSLKKTKAEQEALNKEMQAAKAADRQAEQVRRGMEQRAASLAQSLRTPFEEFRDEIADVRKLFQTGLIDKETGLRAMASAKGRYRESIGEQFREPVLIGGAAKGSAAAYESILKAQLGGDRQDKIRKAVQEAATEALKQTLLLEQINQKTQQAKIAQVPP